MHNYFGENKTTEIDPKRKTVAKLKKKNYTKTLAKGLLVFILFKFSECIVGFLYGIES